MTRIVLALLGLASAQITGPIVRTDREAFIGRDEFISGSHWSRVIASLNTGLSLVESDHGIRTKASHWSRVITGPEYRPLIGR